MKPIYLYNGNITPYAVVFWFKTGEQTPIYRTVCYDAQELEMAIERSKNPRSVHYGMKYQIVMYNPEPDLVAA